MEHIDPSKLKPHPINEKLYAPRDDTDLEESIKRHGIRQPIVINSKRVIISGHRRWKAALKLKLSSVPIEVRDFDNEIIAIIEFNQYRQKTPGEIYEESRALKEELSRIAEAKMKSGKSEDGKAGGRGKKNPSHNRDQGLDANARRTNTGVAATVGTSRNTLSKIEHVMESDETPDEVKSKMRAGTIRVDAAYRQVKKLESIKEREARRAQQPKVKDKFEPELLIGDCIELMKKMPHNSVHLIFTDSPYAISGDDKMTMVGDNVENARFGEWDELSPKEYRKLMKGMIEEAQRVLTPSGSFYCFCDRLFIADMWDMLIDAGMVPKNIMVWVKTNPAPQARRNFFSATEFFVFAVKGSKYTWNELDASEMTNAPEFPKSTGNDRRDFPHPTQKPKDLIKRYIQISTNEGDVVLDPFAGSGSTAAAAHPLKRKCILIEKDKKHAKTIKERIALLEGEDA